MDWKTVIGTLAPVLGTALGGPLAGTALKIVSEALLGKPDGTTDEISKSISSGLDPEIILKLREADTAFQVKMREMDIDIAKLNASTETAYLEDVQSARATSGVNRSIFILGISIVSTFALLMTAVLYGSFQLMVGGIILKDVAVASTVSGLIGSVIGYVAGNAQQVIGYYFGSSKSSSTLSTALAGAVKDSSNILKRTE